MKHLFGLIAIILFLFSTSLFLHKSDSSNEVLDAYVNFQKTYNKYNNEEYRYAIFKENYMKIEAHNANPDKEWVEGVNIFTDLTQEEFEKTYLMTIPPSATKMTIPELELLWSTQAPETVDWRNEGAVTNVKNQGSCGSCWSFSVTGTLEGVSKIQGGALQSFSEQQLVDCCIAPKYQCQGCSGAWPDWAFTYVKDNGITTEELYPYIGRQQKCAKQGGDFKISSYTMLPKHDVDAVTNAVAKQPVSICADASRWSGYRSGIFSNCGLTPLNHAILIVGYTPEAWIVKNSWGQGWGEHGYIRLKRPGNTCGLAEYAITATK